MGIMMMPFRSAKVQSFLHLTIVFIKNVNLGAVRPTRNEAKER